MRKGYLRSVFCDRSALICGIVYAALCVLVRILAGSPYDTIHKFDVSGTVPPLWIFNLLSAVWGFLAGFAAGIVTREVRLCRARGEGEIRAYRGGIFFVALVFLSLIWYPLFFISGRLFLSLIIALLAVVSSALSTLQWKRVSLFSSLVTAAYTLWLFYVLFINLVVLLKI